MLWSRSEALTYILPTPGRKTRVDTWGGKRLTFLRLWSQTGVEKEAKSFLACSSCHKQCHTLGGWTTDMYFSRSDAGSSTDWDWVPAWFWQGFLLGLQMAAFFRVLIWQREKEHVRSPVSFLTRLLLSPCEPAITISLGAHVQIPVHGGDSFNAGVLEGQRHFIRNKEDTQKRKGTWA